MADYREMWKDLGMDLETHDLLCEVLPVAFTDVYLSQKNRPEGMGYYDFVVSEIHGVRPAELIEAQKNGKKVFGSFCIFVPDEVIFAADAIATGLCGGSQFWVPGGEKVLPTNTCPLIKASVGARLDRTCPFFRIADMYIGETTCDGKKKAWEILKEDVPMYVMDLPQMKRRKDYKAWAEEITALKDKVEEFTGNKVDAEKLAASIKLINDKRRALQRLSNFRKNKNIPISGKDVLLISQIAFYDDPTRFTQMTNTLCDELDKRVEEGISVFPKGTKRILLAGTPLAIPNWKLHNIVETTGGAVVCEEMCTGTRYFENLVDEDRDTFEGQVEALAERYMNINCACFTPNEARIDDIKRLVKEYDIDGVIDVNLKFCNLYDTEGFLVERALKEAGIPVLGIETDYTDADAQQLRTRIGAFIEMLG
ncbi:double-cubane-cluster-containing anaerobic reductase [Peptostreptococcus anaerobius]|jgi:benzoyl-CoA reductase/2-hydroxyglutaryl-CoA dehydratase subunit BcrC/BadD/HgdB|uniref:2-hydroxyglutaryl-CoA dehydratase, D-component n=1 Tax=Peptostreptococcus anaerobius TaxID=1261 RepID=A0A135YWE5_9FIRM|nr:double-cubane-cluster-containing anaerobic reductase [Peptostreptococcus anaerobius]KXI13725.1 2-hydroxyglutaryl-CoA dehydratase, D-component [Peptostreptococcus anaerobius]MCB6983239.1 2-hydroxyacyl-CoA dehydratase family protein [Peptostreptococcus anaerobius]MCQ5151102.1 double-cubane-cluster-containing anaerobic reductase [Peptostreptococcus anaerobius]MDB8852272.1 double-cubane-cluster-containing anaerobic reductase [Peptostreptococcus anaerobius]MDU1175404.1 double-cubane-cluster-cont